MNKPLVLFCSRHDRLQIGRKAGEIGGLVWSKPFRFKDKELWLDDPAEIAELEGILKRDPIIRLEVWRYDESVRAKLWRHWLLRWRSVRLWWMRF